jgi:class 3 adenylate cyclase
MNEVSSRYARLAVFLLGLLFLGIPGWVVWNAMGESEERERETRRTEAIEQNSGIISFLRNQESFQTSLDMQLSAAVTQIPQLCEYDRNQRTTAKELRQAALQIRESLRIKNIAPKHFLVFQRSPDHLPLTATETFPLDLPENNETTAFLRKLARDLCLTLNNDLPKAVIKSLTNELMTHLGVHNDFANLTDEFRNRSLLVKIGEQSMYFFWAPLYTPDYVDRIPQDLAVEKHPPPYATTQFPQVFRDKYLIGTALFVIPRIIDQSRQPEAMLNLQATQNTFLALLPEQKRAPVFQTSFPQEWRELVLTGQSLPPGIVTASESINLGFPATLLAATIMKPMDPEMSRRHRLTALALFIAMIAGSAVLFVAVFLEVGVGASLAGQLWWGFTLGALLPVSVAFLSIQQLVDERFHLEIQQQRLNLPQELDSVESRFLLHRPTIWHKMFQFTQNPHLLKTLRRSQDAHNRKTPNSDALRQFMEKGYRFFSELPYYISLRRLIAAGVNQFYYSTAPRVDSDQDLLPQLIGILADGALQELNPRLSDQFSPPTSGKTVITREDFLKESGLLHLHSMFGGEGFLNMIYGQNRPFFMNSGNGNWFINSYLIPAKGKPEFMMTFLYLAKYSDRQALLRILTNPVGPTRFFVYEPDRIGHFVIPEEGRKMPILRSVARQVGFIKSQISLRMELDGEAYQIAASPLSRTKQFIMVAIAPEAPLRKKAREMRFKLSLAPLGMLLLIFLLSWVASWDILVPLRQLQGGMQEISAGRFGFRLLVDRTDELGEVCLAFNDMARGLEEAELMKKMVSSSAGKAMESAEQEALAQAGESIDATVLFIGIPNFEAYLDRHTPVELIEMLHRHTSVICRLIDRRGGEIDKLIGDKTLAYFNHTDLGEQAAVFSALDAAYDLRQADAAGQLPFPIAVGINTGHVIKGLLGSGGIRDFTIIGDPVNLAARAESAAESFDPGLSRIVLTENTLQLMSPRPEVKALNITRVKGKQKQVLLSRLL